jgi:hypothetical protein
MPSTLTARPSIDRLRTLRLRATPWLAAAALGLLLNGCSSTDDSDSGPSVTLATTPTSATAGAVVTLIAVASDDVGVSEVRFFRVDSGANTLLGTLNTSPYQLQATLPANATGSVAYFARAVDTDGNTTDSNQAAVTITN